jgi:two-component system, cell cycle sensor histidine kinase and response regulator CckA
VLHGYSIACEFQLADDLQPVDMDRDQISQVLQNLIINSIQAMPDGGLLTIQASNIMMGNNQSAAEKYIKIS